MFRLVTHSQRLASSSVTSKFSRPAFVTGTRYFSDETKAENGDNQQKADQTGEKPQNDAEVIASLKNEIKNMKDQVLRAYAEAENTRRIAHRDVENARAYANTSFAKAMLDIADDLERAMGVVTPEKRAAADASLKSLIDGIEMTDKNLHKVFGKFGVSKYGTVGEKFDPNVHEALFRIPDAANPDTVGQVVKLGYMIKDRVLRPAQVGARIKPDN